MIKIKVDFMLREVAGSYAVVPVGNASVNFKGLISLNETGAFLWRNLAEGIEKEDLVKKMLAEYDVEESVARNHIDAFIKKLEESGFLE